MAVAVFLLFLVFFVLAMCFKSWIADALEAGQNGKGDFGKMYKQIEEHEDEIFNTICTDAVRIQDCNSTEQSYIFSKSTPWTFWFSTAALLELYGDCSGLDPEIPLDKFFFTNYVT
ncbi:MAG: hypothetical protein P4M11_14325 [Candidatus Pacebacteria bacterium]|nr:hypothetical protein [Candidatus Paceibacterota bacterium]